MNDIQTIEIHNRFDIIEARMQVRTLARKLGLDLFDQARISLAASTVAIAFSSASLVSSSGFTAGVIRCEFSCAAIVLNSVSGSLSASRHPIASQCAHQPQSGGPAA